VLVRVVFFLCAAVAPVAAGGSEVCGAPAIPIHAIQGAGASSPIAGATGIVVEGIVVGDFREFPGQLGGLFVQEEDADADASARSSEGLFVFAPNLAADLRIGDTVRARGQVREFFGLTELGRLEWLKRCDARGAASAAPVALPQGAASDWERFEGMLVRLDQPLVVSGAHDLGVFGELVLAAGERLFAPTQRAAPGPAALAWHERNLRHRLLLDDGRGVRWPTPTPHTATRSGAAVRLGDRIAAIEGVLDFGFGSFRLHPTQPIDIESAGVRPDPPLAPRGALRVAAWNAENYFNGDGAGGGFPTRGAASASELARQQAKLVATLASTGADVFALAELENDGVGPRSAVQQLADALAIRIGAPIGVVDPGPGGLGDQEIAVGILYRRDRVTPVGSPAVLDARAQPRFDATRNRPSLASSFVHVATGERITIAQNHWKSKGSSCASAGDPDRGDGSGECNRTRTLAAESLAAWLAGDPTHAGGAPVLIVGDLNSYPREDPLAALAMAGFVDLLERFSGPDTWSYVFDGAAGRLDHALASPALVPLAHGAAVWHANSDELPLFGYREENPPEWFAPDPVRAADHDPVLVDLFPDGDLDGRTDARDACRDTRPGAKTVVWNGCDSRVPEQLDSAGCTISDRIGAIGAQDLSRRKMISALRRWLREHRALGALSKRESRAILACARRRA
jgi:predicted extracellular nuclease